MNENQPTPGSARAAHTALPWRIVPFADIDKWIEIAPSGVRVDNDDVDPEEAKANAELIVASVNRLPALQAAAEKALAAAQALIEDEWRMSAEWGPRGERDHILEQARNSFSDLRAALNQPTKTK